jgi:acyl-CoA reductase-like NAD-dependent aldehyde dehydrogenase
MKDKWPYFLANEAQSPNSDLEVTDKFTGDVATRGAMADTATIDAGIAASVEAAEPMRRMKPYERQAILNHCVHRFTDFDAAIAEVNDSTFGLQAGVFTRDIYKANKAWDELEVGGVVIGDVPSWRVDNMPYGGVKDSGLGREGTCVLMR